MKKIYHTLAILLVVLNLKCFSQSVISKELYKNAVMDIKKSKNYKKYTKKSCNKNEVKILPILWLGLDEKNDFTADDTFFQNSFLYNSKMEKVRLDAINERDTIIFEGIVYDTCNTILSTYSEAKFLLSGGVITKINLLNAILENDIIEVYHFPKKNNYPYILIGQDRKIYEYTDILDEDGKYVSKLTEL